MQTDTPTFYVEQPTIPAGMTCQEYRRSRGASRPRSLHRRVGARVKRALRRA